MSTTRIYDEFQSGLKGNLNPDNVLSTATKGEVDAFKKAAAELQTLEKHVPSGQNERISKLHEKVKKGHAEAFGGVKSAVATAEKAQVELNNLLNPKDANAAKPSTEVIEAAKKRSTEAQEALKKAEKKLAIKEKALGSIEDVSDRFNKGDLALKADKSNKATKMGQHPDVAAKYAKSKAAFDTVIDAKGIETRNIESVAKELAGKSDKTSPAKGDGKSWASKFKPEAIIETFKGSSTGMKFGRVAGTGVGLVMVYDGISRGKSGDQDRSALVRIGEVAAGLGVAGASLAYRG